MTRNTKRDDDQTRRRALIMNGAHPDFKNDFDKNSGFARNAKPMTMAQLERKWARQDAAKRKASK